MEQTATATPRSEEEGPERLVLMARLRRALADVMSVDVSAVQRGPDEVLSFLGTVRGDTEKAFERIEKRFAELGYTARLRERPDGKHEVHAIKGIVDSKPGKIWINVVLFLATVLSALYLGAYYAMGDAGLLNGSAAVEQDPLALLLLPLAHLHRGIPFAATLLGILVTHEASHYVVGRLYGRPSLPYFIPMPLNPFGTMGAVIVSHSHMRSRKAVFDTGIAGPLGGLVVAIPLLVVGLALSSVGPIPPGVEVVQQEGNSLLYLGIKYLMFGKLLPSGGEDVWLHPVAFAAWGGLFITMLNLFPIGQLDGGHISYALLGRHARALGMAVVAASAACGSWLLVQGNSAGGVWLVWAVFNLLLNPRHPPPLDDATKLDGRRVVLGVLMLLLFVLLFIPAPLRDVIVD